MKLRPWYLVHGTIDVSPPPSGMLDSIRPPINGLEHDFPINDGHWHHGTFWLLDATASVVPIISVRRMLPGDTDYPPHLKGWDNHLNELPDQPNREYILEHMRKTRQSVLLTPRGPIGDSKLARMCEQLCGYLARASEGLIHVFQEGYFTPEGESLWPQNPKHKLKTK